MNRKAKKIMSRVGVIALLALLSFFMNQNISPTEEEVSTQFGSTTNYVEVHYIDVGQGDAILIETENASMLIDAGENTKGTLVADYLKERNITELDYVIGTHPHSDHIGGLDTILKNFTTKKVILPQITHTTKTFEDVIDAIEANQLKITLAKVGETYRLGPAEFTIVAPNSSSYDDINNYSVGIKLTYGSTSFLFTGDAEKLSEDEMLKNGINLSSDVLKLAHHGSAYSSSDLFLDAVHPNYVIISAGQDNQYNHPHAETLQRMLDREIKVYRTDVQGTIVFSSDGKNISVNTGNYKITDTDLEN
jgi:competence protein ComEC